MSHVLDSEQLKASVLGDELDIEECQVLAKKMGIRQFSDGDLLVTVENADSTLFILAQGRIAVVKHKG